jgi:hypothetical protein
MLFAVAKLLQICLLAAAVNATNVLTPQPVNLSESFIWFSRVNSTKVSDASGNLLASADSCGKDGNEGVLGLSFDRCMELCLVMPQCEVVAFWPSWLGGPSACFAKDQTQVPVLMGSASSTPIPTADQGAYVGRRI